MADWKLTDYDLDITDGDVTLITDQEAIAQDIKMNLRTWLGESIYDQGAGVPYLQVIFVRGTNIGIITQVLKQVILNVRGVTGVDDLIINSLDAQSRTLSLTANVHSVDGDIDFSDLIQEFSP